MNKSKFSVQVGRGSVCKRKSVFWILTTCKVESLWGYYKITLTYIISGFTKAYSQMLYSKLKTMNSVRSNSLSLELTPSVCKDIRIRKSEFVATTKFLFFCKSKELLLQQIKLVLFSLWCSVKQFQERIFTFFCCYFWKKK